ncbi:MAG: TolC family protein [Bacteroidota bacterium]
MTRTFLILLFFISISIQAQEIWSLAKCIDHAMENNINLNLTKNKIKTQKVNTFEAKANLLPSLNLGSGLGVSWGRNIDGNTNEVTFDQTIGNNYWIESSMTFFQGFVKYNTISYNNYMLKASKKESEKELNSLVMNILSAYYKVIYSKELENVAQDQVDLSKSLVKRMEKLVEVGRESGITIQELKSQWANDKLILSRAANNTMNAILEIKQLLRLNESDDFNIDLIDLQLFSVTPAPQTDSVYNNALSIMPEIKQQEYLLKASKKSLAMSRGLISPRLNVSARIGTNYFNGNSVDFTDQIENNQNKSVFVGLTIPIFNSASTYSKIKKNKISLQDQELLLEQKKDNLYANIRYAINDLESAKNEYFASTELQEYSKLTLKNATKKLEKGLASTTDFDVAKQRFTSAEAELIKSKLMYIMRNYTIIFYQTGNWKHVY